MAGFGIQELLIILVIVVLLFGVKKLPQIGKDLGQGIKNLKTGLSEIGKDKDDEQT